MLSLLLTAACAKDKEPERDRAPRDSKLAVYIVPYLSPTEVERIAQQVATTNGIALERYYDPIVHFDTSNSNGNWQVSFQMKDPTPPGGHFTVLVNDRTSKTTYMAGE